MRGKRALVTGSVAGLGHAIAASLAAAGADVMLHGLEPPQVARAAADRLARETGARVLLSRADLTDVGQIEAMMAQAEEELGGIDILVNNAVVRHFAPVDQLRTEQWNEALAVNLSAAFHAVRLSLPGMRERGWGRIVNMSSVYGAGATPDRIAYITTKTALIGMTRAIAIETARTGVTCNALMPGTVPTPPIVERIAGIAASRGISEAEAASDYLRARQPTGRFVAMESVAAMAMLLCSTAGADITGAMLPVDGGWTAA
ncbi:beta-D-hydroxybutyrate dehydrogenase [Bordetella genomosp. 11]|uniref:Beta-D-hydroxybutyrate dehydrogenase n=1 Tax=Bordetella genomosp. 11 TaxID=1416808 RepID=A0A261UT57_9BORD|nr:beta-D-hydroxybutyrate dehydrogenase [Bordetella genomosp. 11]